MNSIKPRSTKFFRSEKFCLSNVSNFLLAARQYGVTNTFDAKELIEGFYYYYYYYYFSHF